MEFHIRRGQLLGKYVILKTFPSDHVHAELAALNLELGRVRMKCANHPKG